MFQIAPFPQVQPDSRHDPKRVGKRYPSENWNKHFSEKVFKAWLASSGGAHNSSKQHDSAAVGLADSLL
jgi:hypothetical protein